VQPDRTAEFVARNRAHGTPGLAQNPDGPFQTIFSIVPSGAVDCSSIKRLTRRFPGDQPCLGRRTVEAPRRRGA
jgi:hypothetical protein